MDLAKLYSTQISMTEWFEKINHSQTAALREEDNKKRDRLKIIKQVTGMPFDEPTQFPAADIAERTPAFQKFLDEHGDELCALRLIPHNPELPKLRLRGKTIRDVLDWFNEQPINPKDYAADFVPHAEGEPLYSTIFVVNKNGIFGEIIKGGHYQLTQGFYDKHKPVSFWYDWKTWHFSEEAPEYKEWLREITKWLHIPDVKKQATLKKQLNATFAHDYLQGYFETITNEGPGLWFIDYNRIMGDMFADTQFTKTDATALVSGRPASKGKATGLVAIVLEEDIAGADMPEGAVLVCDITTPDYMPLIQKASAVVTDRGGILSHAAIVCRELGKPCVAATGNGANVLKPNQLVTVDADTGTVTVAKQRI